MKKYYICKKCIENKIGRSIYDLSVSEFNIVKHEECFIDDMCPDCGASDGITQVYGIETSYVRGYGFLDKKGVKRDMDMHLMNKNQDPYKDHRKPGEDREVMDRLRRSREFDKRSKTFHT